MEQQSEKSNQKKPISAILILLLVVVAGFAAYMAYNNQQLNKRLTDLGYLKQEVEDEKNRVIDELEGMTGQYDSLAITNDSMNVELMAQREKVEELIAKAKNNEWTVYKLRKEAGTLREIMKGYVRTIDSLNTLNVELRAENAQVTRKLSETESKNTALRDANEQLSEKVKLGAKLKALDMVAYGQRVKRNGVHRETDRSDKVEKIKVCFTLDKNEVAESGNKNIFVRIIAPSGQVLAERSDDGHMFDFAGTRGLFSVKKLVNYEKQELDLCMYFEDAKNLQGGDYIVDAYADQMKIGSTKFTLK
jgi:hypothetical protein